MTGLAEVQRAISRICFDETPSEADLAALHSDRDRWLMYRRMVRNRLFAMVRSGLPKTSELIGKEAFDAAVSSYFADRRPRTRFIREVVHELVAHALPQWESDPAMPAHLGELVRYEEAKWRVASMPSESPAHKKFEFEAVPVFSRTIATVELRHRVDKDPLAPPPLDVAALALVFRKPGDARTYTLVLDDLKKRLFAAWRGGESCADGARTVLADLGQEPDAQFVDTMAGLLADLIDGKVILGSKR